MAAITKPEAVLNAAQQPSPALFFETMNAYQRTEALKAAIELDVFSAIGKGNANARTLAEGCGASERGMRILCDYLVTIGFLSKSGDRYSLTLDSATFLDHHSPAYLGCATKFLASSTLTSGFKDLAAAVRKGGTVLGHGGMVAPEQPVWQEFARSMAPLMVLPAELIATRLLNAAQGKPWKVLDIAAGHGLFGITLAKHNPKAQVVALDWKGVLEVAEENARSAGVASRFSTIPGSAFEADFGGGYDLVLLTNFIHHFDPPTCERLLRKVHAALSDGGRAVTLEFVPNEDRVSPTVPAQFSLMMLGSTEGGDAYPFTELDRMFRSAGFRKNELHPLPPTFEHVVISHK